MARVPIVGGSYDLRVRKADVQRSINLFPSIVESGTGKAPAILQSIPGLTVFSNPGTGTIRGFGFPNNRLFTVSGNRLQEIDESGAVTERGTLVTSVGRVEIQNNLFQLIVTDGNGYVLTLSDNTFQQINDPAFAGSVRFAMLDGRAIFNRIGTREFYWSAIDDALSYDALAYDSAEGTTDNVVAPLADHGQLFLFKQYNIEVWDVTGDADQPYQRNSGAHIETGCAAPFTICKLDNTIYWFGQDAQGVGIVWRLSGYTPQRVSTQAIEEVLQGATDIAGASAYTYQMDGHSFYALQVPGLSTTWVFDVAAKAWHERAEFVKGEYRRHRGTCHVFAYGRHLIGADDGKIYQFDPTVNNNAGDILLRERISPHFAAPGMERQFFSSFELDCTVGQGKPGGTAPRLMLRYSNDGGEEYGNWRTTSLGVVGQRKARARFLRCGSARDRVWQVRVTDDTPFAIVGANVT